MFKNTAIPILLAISIFVALCALYWSQISILNLFPGEDIYTHVNLADIAVGATIYLKTSIDFSLLIGILMSRFPGVKNRIAIELGTALGNALGTMLVLTIWFFFKQINWLLAIMVIFAGLVLLKMAQETLKHVGEDDPNTNLDNQIKKPQTLVLASKKLIDTMLTPINRFFHPVLGKIMPELSFDTNKKLSWFGLFTSSFTIPFILGTDDFAGYVPLF